MRELSSLYVDSNEARGTDIVEQLTRLKVPVEVKDLDTDYLWYADGLPIMGERKSVKDLIASHGDGRLHNQAEAMHRAASYKFILLEGNTSGKMVGHRKFGWYHDSFDNLCAEIQDEGIVIYRAREGQAHTRLRSIYDNTAKEKRSWHDPIPRIPLIKTKFVDKEAEHAFRKRCACLIALVDSLGADKAKLLLEAHTLKELLGVADENLASAKKLWLEVKGVGTTIWDNFERALNE